MELYGIIGAKFSGKDTFARMVGGDFHITHFAAKLKRLCSAVFSIPMESFQDPFLKEKPFPEPIFLDAFLPDLRSLTGLDLEPQGLLASNPRLVLQLIGTDYVRKAKATYWLDVIRNEIKPYQKVLIPDTRFINEGWTVRSEGGKIIKIDRIDAPKVEDLHPSEVEMNTIVPDLVVGSITGKLWLPQLIADLISEGKFDTAKLYDYRRWLTKDLPWNFSSREVQEADSIMTAYYQSSHTKLSWTGGSITFCGGSGNV